jgi:hypothetical protein
MTLLRNLRRRLNARLNARFRREDGGATIEFCVLFPLFVFVFGSGLEAGLLNSRHAMLERAVDLAVRDLRLGRDPTPTYAELKSAICNYAGVIPDCDKALHLELEKISTADWRFRQGAVQCIDREEDITPAVSFTGGGFNDMMLVTVCAVFKPIFPNSGLGRSLPRVGKDDYALIAMSAFVNEP